ncbi:MAG: HlyD family efflux transporter periplasmic adaptor subunit [Hyphomicrobiaceae bacterium]|nr:MAG: HlyD family efflux transporter periplasmic adaptor subunit [Hyphomicrobiaceae bacterium]
MSGDNMAFPGTIRVLRLDISGPLMVGLFVVLLFFGAGLGWAAHAPIVKGATAMGQIVVESKSRPVQHMKGGTVAKIHVVDGQRVEQGDLIVTLDDKDIREAIRSTKGQIEQTTLELTITNQEIAITRELVNRQLAPRPKLAALERQAVQNEKDMIANRSKLAALIEELRRVEIKSPVAGRVLAVAVTSEGSVVAPGGTVAEVTPTSDRLVVEARLAANDIEDIHPQMKAKVWLLAQNRRESDYLTGTLLWLSPDTVEDKRTGQPYYTARIALDERRSDIEKRIQLYPGMRTEILIVKGHSTMLNRLLDPLTRHLNRAFRSH